MGSERRAKGCLVAAVVWLIILAILGASYKFLIHPRITGQGLGSDPLYQHTVTLALDSFSGYCILRSPAVREQLKAARIKISFEDDKADYEARMKALRSGKVQMAAFTIDSFLLNGARLGEFPAVIVLIVDETKGADAIVSYKEAVGSIRDLDSPEARFVLTPNSPSEFLARTVIAHFSLPSLPEKCWVEADGAAEVYKEFRAARKTDRRAYVLWEPYVSKALKEPSAHVLLDSGKLKGYIVDVLVAERKFLKEQPEVVAKIAEAYLRAAYSYSSQEEGMVGLIADDAKTYGAESLSADEAQELAKGIQWKNTTENYAHFGLLSQAESAGLQHIEDMIANIGDVLVKTGALDRDPIGDKAYTIYYNRILADLQAAKFHPGQKLNILADVESSMPKLDTVRSDVELPALSEAEWNSLIPVGELRIEPVFFARGTARINIQSRRDLEKLVKRMQSFPQYYLVVTGNVRAEGDAEANQRLADERAQVVAQTLVELGLHKNRIRAVAAVPTTKDGSAQSVAFVVGQVPY